MYVFSTKSSKKSEELQFGFALNVKQKSLCVSVKFQQTKL